MLLSDTKPLNTEEVQTRNDLEVLAIRVIDNNLQLPSNCILTIVLKNDHFRSLLKEIGLPFERAIESTLTFTYTTNMGLQFNIVRQEG